MEGGGGTRKVRKDGGAGGVLCLDGEGSWKERRQAGSVRVASDGGGGACFCPAPCNVLVWLSVRLFDCLRICCCLFVCFLVCLLGLLFICLFAGVCLPYFYLLVCLLACLLVCLFVCLLASFFVCLLACLFVCLVVLYFHFPPRLFWQEYNDNCRVVRDLERLSPDTKISWAATPKYGPFKARDFVTVVHYRTLDDGTMVVVNRAVEHPAARYAR